MMLVRIVHADEELKQVEQSHVAGPQADAMLEGISAMHRSIRAENPAWLLELMRAMPLAPERPRDGGERVRLDELREWAHAGSPWWI